jgi:hypothetical protein
VQIDKLLKTESGVTKPLLPSDTKIVASKGSKKTAFEVNGKAVEPEVEQALGLLIMLGNNDEDNRTDDELFGTRERKRVGETWDANPKALARLFKRDGPLAAKDLVGKVTLKDVLKDSSGARLLVGFEVTGNVAALKPPPGMTVQEGTMRMKGTREFPVEASASLSQAKETMEMTMSMRLTGKPHPSGPEVEMAVTSKRSMMGNATEVK